jgi:hypothetical protein
MNDETVTLIRLWLKDKSEADRFNLYDKHVLRREDEIEMIIKSHVEEYGLNYPLDLGKRVNYLRNS